MNLDQDKVKKAIKGLDWTALRQELEVVGLTEKELQVVLVMVLRSDSMVRRRPGDDGAARDYLLTELQSYLDEKGLDDAASTVAELHKIFRYIDKGYIAIFSEEAKLQFSSLSPERRVSAILSFLAHVGRTLQLDHERAVEGANVISPNMTIKDTSGAPYNPNAIYHGFTLAATDALQLEGYRHSYFNAAGELVLPVPVPVTQTDEAAAELKLINASLWRRWKTADERHRLLQARLDELTPPRLPEWISNFAECEKIVTAFEFQSCSEIERLDAIASERFEVRMIQTFQEMLLKTNLLKIVAASPASKVELPPRGILSAEEGHAGTMLGQFLGLSLDQTKAGSLLLSERLRGYAVLRRLVETSVKADGTYFPVLTRAEIQEEFLRCGLSASSADAFIKAATFNRSSRDMYDQPMIRLSNGSYLLFGFSLIASDLVKLMISSLENAKLSFQKRGPAFEKHIIELLRAQKFDAKTLKVKRGPKKEVYDYDVTFVWGEYVFFIECKNRGIPFGNPIAVANFEEELSDHAEQVKRLRKALNDYPDIITVEYPQAIGKKPVFCVVFSLPFSMGHHDGVYYIDESLLGRFFKPGGSLGKELGRAKPGEVRYRVELAMLWASDAPTPEDFIRYMENPPQLQLAAAKYELRADLLRLSEDVALWYADWHRKNLSDAEEASILTEIDLGMREKAKSITDSHDA
ncbi:hypothetical protein CF70_031145 [Cupriavidus sp. SK-3]|uniref:hypothetical protein n=1 Tax=Cupriavidus sp. SK-3 TaxID=1470558 RepID=UPI000445EF7A|nr:hypothetical protein [Cupriavidus sp. SK-3]KDP89460.1 hypothetical protein CF70_031145 [Cupriavidus sp. SK-3]